MVQQHAQPMQQRLQAGNAMSGAQAAMVNAQNLLQASVQSAQMAGAKQGMRADGLATPGDVNGNGIPDTLEPILQQQQQQAQLMQQQFQMHQMQQQQQQQHPPQQQMMMMPMQQQPQQAMYNPQSMSQ